MSARNRLWSFAPRHAEKKTHRGMAVAVELFARLAHRVPRMNLTRNWTDVIRCQRPRGKVTTRWGRGIFAWGDELAASFGILPPTKGRSAAVVERCRNSYSPSPRRNHKATCGTRQNASDGQHGQDTIYAKILQRRGFTTGIFPSCQNLLTRLIPVSDGINPGAAGREEEAARPA